MTRLNRFGSCALVLAAGSNTAACSTLLGINDVPAGADGGSTVTVGGGLADGTMAATDSAGASPSDATVGEASSLSSASSSSGSSTSSSGTSGSSSSSSGSSGSFACTPGAQQCASATVIETCGPDGQWGNPWTCATGLCVANGVVGSEQTYACSGATTAATSCSGASGPGLTNCGAADESCCASVEVPGGMYARTYTNSGAGATAEADPASVSGFRMDKYLVTVGRFRQFVNAWNGGYLPAAGSGKHVHLNAGNGLVNSATQATDGAADGYEAGWDATDWNGTTDINPTTANLTTICDATYATWTAAAGSQENLPINCLDWYEAYAFCIWDGGFLPSESEWEYVAAGGGEQLEYPWGSTAPGTACPGTGCEYAIYNCDYPSGSGTCTGVTNIAAVGTASLGVALWGQLDMAGEVFEWNLDSYNSSYVDPCTDCAYLTSTSDRVRRGGDLDEVAPDLLPPDRGGAPPTNRYVVVGLRCARTP